jgi:hypothetical protein
MGRLPSSERTCAASCFAIAPPLSMYASGISLPIPQITIDGWLRSRSTMAEMSRCHHSSKSRP